MLLETFKSVLDQILYELFLSIQSKGIISNNKIKITVNNIQTGGAIASDASGIDLLNTIVVSRNNVELNINNSTSNSIQKIGGSFGEANYVNISDSINKNYISLNTSSLGTVSGVVGVFNNGLMTRSYSAGDIDVLGQGLNEYGGLVGISDSGSISNSFSLMSHSLTNCLVKCGKILGDTYNPISVVFDNLYSSINTISTLGFGAGNVSIVETDIDTITNPNYFNNKLNSPMDTFDFNTIWLENVGDLPSLR